MITHNVGAGALTIYINGLPHLKMRLSDLIDVQSWIIGDKRKLHTIEFTFKDNIIKAEYADKEKRAAILTIIDELELFGLDFET